MKRRLAMLAGAAMLSTVGMLVPASPASANVQTDTCAGTGNAVLSLGLGLPGLAPANLVLYAFTFVVGTCAVKGNVSGQTFATGHVHGWCGHSTGSGITATGARFHHISAGGTLVIFGHLNGTVNAVADPTAGSCTNKTATRFLITGVVTLQGVTLPADGCAGLPATFNCL